MRRILRYLIETLGSGGEAIHCQVVATRGSTPQKAGAAMIVDPMGGQIGTLGGGCVENEVKLAAIRRLGEPGAELHVHILDHDYAWADGLICGGRMEILTESLVGREPIAYYQAQLELIEAGEGYTEAVVLDPAKAKLEVPLGTRYLFDSNGAFVAALPKLSGVDAIARRLEPLENRPKVSVRDGIAFLPEPPRVRMIVIGAGHVGQAVAGLAAQADFDVWVVDDRAQYANAERFPDAKKIIVGPFEDVLPKLDINPHTYVLVVTRGHGHDQEAIFHTAPTRAAYVGLIGSKRKIRLIFDGLRELGISDEALGRVTAPVGLDIGSQTVAEIAVSITAQLIAVRNLGKSRADSSDAGSTREPAIEVADPQQAAAASR